MSVPSATEPYLKLFDTAIGISLTFKGPRWIKNIQVGVYGICCSAPPCTCPKPQCPTFPFHYLEILLCLCEILLILFNQWTRNFLACKGFKCHADGPISGGSSVSHWKINSFVIVKLERQLGRVKIEHLVFITSDLTMFSEKYTCRLNILISADGMWYLVILIEVEVPIESLICHLTLSMPLFLVIAERPRIGASNGVTGPIKSQGSESTVSAYNIPWEKLDPFQAFVVGSSYLLLEIQN